MAMMRFFGSKKAKKLIDSKFFKNEEELLDYFNNIPKDANESTIYRAIILGLVKCSKLDSLTSKTELEVKRIIFEELGMNRQPYSGITYRELAQKQDNRFAIDAINNLHGDVPICGVVEKLLGNCLYWLSTQYNIKFSADYYYKKTIASGAGVGRVELSAAYYIDEIEKELNKELNQKQK